jgi:hypothetical protein
MKRLALFVLLTLAWPTVGWADFLVKTGTRDGLTAPDTQIVVTGFRPKALITLTNILTNHRTISDHANFGIGISHGNSGYQLYSTELDASATSVSDGYIDTTIFATRTSGGGPISDRAAILQFNDSGFHMNWTTGGTAKSYSYLALGGSDITNVYTAVDTIATATGNKAYTGVGFQPEFLLILFADSVTIKGTTSSSGTASNAQASIGVASSATDEAVTMGWAENAAAIGDTYSRQKTGAMMIGLSPGSPATVNVEASLISFDSDGFTLNYSSVNGDKQLFAYLAIKGGSYKVGVETAKTTTGTKATSGIGFQPKALFLTSHSDTAATGLLNHGRVMSGVVSSAADSGMYVVQSTSEDGADPTDASTAYNDTLGLYLTNVFPPVGDPESSAKLSTFDADGFTLNYLTADSARQFIYTAFGPEPAGASPSLGVGGNTTIGGGVVVGGK